MLRLRNLDAGYGALAVLRRVSLHVSQGEIVTIVGANGAGKTTLLRTIMGLLRARAGEIAFDGRDVTDWPTERTVALGCSLVPEGRQVFAPMPVSENLLLGAHVQFRRGKRHEVAEDLERVYGLFPILKTREVRRRRGRDPWPRATVPPVWPPPARQREAWAAQRVEAAR